MNEKEARPLSESAPAQDLRLCMVAAERSGDMLAALLLQGMRKSWPQLQAFGIGGPQMDAVGFVSRWSCDELSVRGLVEALWRYRHINWCAHPFGHGDLNGCKKSARAWTMFCASIRLNLLCWRNTVYKALLWDTLLPT